jgi:hypothetical protein
MCRSHAAGCWWAEPGRLTFVRTLNPCLDPDDPFFGVPRQIACLPDGSLAVASTAKLHKEGRFKDNPYASGFWRIAQDGAGSSGQRVGG